MSEFRRLPPQNLEAERGVLGSILLLNECLDEVEPLLSEEDWYCRANALIWRSIRRLRDKGSAIDATTLYDDLKQWNSLEDVGGDDYLVLVMESVPHAAHAVYYAKIVREQATRRRVLEAHTAGIERVYDSPDDAETVLGKSEADLFAISSDRAGKESQHIGDVLQDVFARLETPDAAPRRGLSVPQKDLDEMLFGLGKGHVVIVAARPGMGKTAIALNWVDHAAKLDRKVLVFSLEMGKVELVERLVSIRSRFDYRKLQENDLDELDRGQLMEVANELHQQSVWIDDHPKRTVSQIAAACRRRQRKGGLDLVVIDYLQLLTSENPRDIREQQIAAMTRSLKVLAKELEIPVVVLCQINRSSVKDGATVRPPRSSDLRESGAIEQDADVVLLLHRPDAYDPDDRPGEADLIVDKNRSGKTGVVRSTWRGNVQRFDDLATAIPDEVTTFA